jgi:DNA-binding NtrC family response regulator
MAPSKNIKSASRENMNAFQHYHWLGNVRELRDVIKRAMIVAKDRSCRSNRPAERRPP